MRRDPGRGVLVELAEDRHGRGQLGDRFGVVAQIGVDQSEVLACLGLAVPVADPDVPVDGVA